MDGGDIDERQREKSSEAGSLPTQRILPWLIISLVGVNWAVFLYSLYKNNCPGRIPRDECILQGILGRFSFQPLEENPQFGPAASTLVDMGGLKWNFREKQSSKWHILLSILFHTGLLDLIFDTISLLYMGTRLEQNFGIVKIGSLYFLSSLGGSLWASFKFYGVVYVGGPSGVCGLTGGGFAELFVNLNMHEEKFKRFLSLCLGFAINFNIKLLPWADASANIGGFYMGFLLGFLLLIRCQPESAVYKYKCSGFDYQKLKLNYRRYQRVLWVIALSSTVIQFLYSLIKYIMH